MKKLAVLAVLLVLAAGCYVLPWQKGKEQSPPVQDTNAQETDQNNAVAEDENRQADQNQQQALVDENTQQEQPALKTGNLSVTLKSEDENFVAGASVSIDKVDATPAFHAVKDSDENGQAMFPDAPVGNYIVNIDSQEFEKQTLEASVEEDKNNSLDVNLTRTAPPPPSFKPIKWQKTLNDGNISINPDGFLQVNRNQKKLLLFFRPDEIGQLAGKTLEWRMKIVSGTASGFALQMELFEEPKNLLKVQVSVDRVLLTGNKTEKLEKSFKDDYHTFKLAFDAQGTATLFVDGQEELKGVKLTDLVPVIENKKIYFANYESVVSMDYFYIDSDSDGSWDYKEEWNNLDNVAEYS